MAVAKRMQSRAAPMELCLREVLHLTYIVWLNEVQEQWSVRLLS